MSDRFRIYRRWFYAAALYNAVWGIAVVACPATLLQVTGVPATGALPLVRVMGMMVGVYAYGYYLLARQPQRYSGFIWIGLAGKTFGPVGFLYSAATGALPWRFGWVCLFNDVVWWPVFWRFALTHAAAPFRDARRARRHDLSAPRRRRPPMVCRLFIRVGEREDPSIRP
jgi:hypothetical protein